MSLQNKLLASTTLLAVFGVGLAPSVSASPLPIENGHLVSQVTSVSNTSDPIDTTTRVAGKVTSVFGEEYVRVRLDNGDTRLVPIRNDAFATRRIIPGSDVIVTMQGNRIVNIARASEADLIALEEEQQRQETAVRPTMPETIVQTERVEQEQVVEQRRPVVTQQPQVTPAPQPVRPVRAMW
jgi:translation initiation factor IF-1